MNNCCGPQSSSKFEKKQPCPECKEMHNLTPYQTVLHQVCSPVNQDLDEECGYYFCRTKNCNVVYFDSNNNIFVTENLRWPVGQKIALPSRQICYCFDVTY